MAWELLNTASLDDDPVVSREESESWSERRAGQEFLCRPADRNVDEDVRSDEDDDMELAAALNMPMRRRSWNPVSVELTQMVAHSSLAVVLQSAQETAPAHARKLMARICA